jgi:hypothetical protein
VSTTHALSVLSTVASAVAAGASDDEAARTGAAVVRAIVAIAVSVMAVMVMRIMSGSLCVVCACFTGETRGSQESHTFLEDFFGGVL